jgi:transposase
MLASSCSSPRDQGTANFAVVEKKLARVVAEEAARHPDTPVEIFATDEHRIGLKPITRRVWAPRGERPVALGHHRYEWLYVTAFVQPTSGETFWYLSNGVSKPFFEKLLATFAAEAGAGAGAGRQRRIVLVLDNAGWHTEPGLAVPDGIRLVYLPRYSPELQPAECLWPLLDEPLVNRHFATLDEVDRVVARRCLDLDADPASVKARTHFHWWPKPCQPA